MNKLLLSAFSIFLISFGMFANVSVEGHYQGKNLFVQNPEDEMGMGYCITRATVNGDPVPGGIGMSAFEIDFANDFNIKVGEHVIVELEHEEGCRPKFLNPQVLLPKSTFRVTEMTCTPEGKLLWKTTGEQGELPFVIEQFRWDKWVNVGEVNGVGKNQENSYEYTLTPHSGENQVRVAQTDHTGRKKTSEAVTFESQVAVVTAPPKKVKKEIKFSAETRFEIFDAYGNIVKKGVAQVVDVTNLKKGVYYVNYDNNNVKIFKT